jgi:hypothetical protein
MSTTSAPYGLQPISNASGTPRVTRIYNGIASAFGTAIYTNQAVFIDPTTGQIQPVTATTDKIYGVFMGVHYTPAAGLAPINSNTWAASTAYVTTDQVNNPMWCEVAMAYPGARFRIQADGTVAQAAFGQGLNLSNFATNNGLGLSTCTANHTAIAGSSQGQLVLTDFYQAPDSVAGDTYTDLIVAVAYPQIIWAGQTSIG